MGGGIEADGTVTLINSTISDNSATQYGGGIQSYGVLNLTNVTFSGNHADLSGGNIHAGVVTAKNTILANATAGGNCMGNITDGGGNLRWPSTDTSCVGAYGDPKLGTLQDNGGPTKTMALGAGSAALEASVAANCPATDQRGQPRPNPPGTPCDVGAYASELRPTNGTAPPNDEFNLATQISSMPHTANQDTSAATTASDDPVFTCIAGKGSASVWFRFAPATNGTLRVNTTGSNYDTVLAIWGEGRFGSTHRIYLHDQGAACGAILLARGCV